MPEYRGLIEIAILCREFDHPLKQRESDRIHAEFDARVWQLAHEMSFTAYAVSRGSTEGDPQSRATYLHTLVGLTGERYVRREGNQVVSVTDPSERVEIGRRRGVTLVRRLVPAPRHRGRPTQVEIDGQRALSEYRRLLPEWQKFVRRRRGLRDDGERDRGILACLRKEGEGFCDRPIQALETRGLSDDLRNQPAQYLTGLEIALSLGLLDREDLEVEAAVSLILSRVREARRPKRRRSSRAKPRQGSRSSRRHGRTR